MKIPCRAQADEAAAGSARFVGRPDVRDPAMALTREPLAREIGDLGLVGHDGIDQPSGLRCSIHQDNGHVVRNGRALDPLVVHAGDENAVHALVTRSGT